jgi:hypothetical protein
VLLGTPPAAGVTSCRKGAVEAKKGKGGCFWTPSLLLASCRIEREPGGGEEKRGRVPFEHPPCCWHRVAPKRSQGRWNKREASPSDSRLNAREGAWVDQNRWGQKHPTVSLLNTGREGGGCRSVPVKKKILARTNIRGTYFILTVVVTSRKRQRNLRNK